MKRLFDERLLVRRGALAAKTTRTAQRRTSRHRRAIGDLRVRSVSVRDLFLAFRATGSSGNDRQK